MNGDRHEKVASLIKEQVATFIEHEANTDPLITVTRVTTSRDYRNATVHITTIPDGREEDALVFLRRSGREMRHYVMKHCNMKIIPHLDFALDVGEKHRQHIDELVQEAGIESTYEGLKEVAEKDTE